MSKVLKFIVHFIVICTIICVLGLALPPFFGVNTVIMDSADKATNLPLGSVTYAIPAPTAEVTAGTPILVQEDSKTYRYNVASLDLANGTGTVIDPSVTGGEAITVAVSDYVPKIVITIGYVGYLLIATKSIEGLIILGLAILFLIILYVIAELWKKEPDTETEIKDTPARYVKSAKELKKEEKIRARLMKEEEREIKRQRKQSKQKKKTIRTGGFVDEIEDDELEEEEVIRPAAMQTAASEAHEVLKKEIAAATAEEVPEPAPAVQATRQIVEEVSQEIKKPAPEKAPEEKPAAEPKVYQKLAIPVMTAAQLMEQAKAEGDAPEVDRDDITKVTFLDYSGIIAGDGDEEE